MKMLTPRFFVAAALVAQAPALPAQSTLYWDGGTTGLSSGSDGASSGQSGTWNTTLTNWDATTSYVAWVNSQNDTAVFGGTSGTSGTPNTVTLGTAITAGGLAFNTNFYRLTGSTLTLAGSASPGIAVSSGNTAEINSTLAGTGGFAKSGAGTLVLTGTNTLTGNLSILGGLVLASTDRGFGAVPGSAVSDQVTLNGGGIGFSAAGQTLSANRGITLGASGGTLDTTAITTTAATSTFASLITGTGPLTIRATGNLSFNGGSDGGLGVRLTNAGNNFTGDITVASGLLSYSSDAVFGNAANAIILNGGGLIDNNVNVTVNRNIQVLAGGGTFRLWGSANATFRGSLSGSGNINRTDGGTLTLSGDLSGFSGTYNNQNNSVTNLTGATASSIGGNWTISGGTLRVNSAADQTLAGVVSGTGAFVKNGYGTLTLTNGNTNSGSTTVQGGTLRADFNLSGARTSNVLSSSSALTLAGGNLTLVGKAGVANSQAVNGLTLSLAGGMLTGSTLRLETGSATSLSLTVGAITRSVGSFLNLIQDAAPGASSGLITTTANINGILGGYAVINGTDWAVANSGSGVSALASYTLQSGTWSTAANIDVQGSVTVGSGLGANTIRFNTAGAHTVTLAGTNSIGNSSGTANVGGILVTPNVGANTVTLTGGTLTTGLTSATNTATDLVVIQDNTAGSMTLASLIADNGGSGNTTGLTKAGAGTLVLTANNTFKGAVNVHGGTLEVQSKTNNVSYNVARGATLRVGYNTGGGYTPGVTINGNGVDDPSGLYILAGRTFQTNGGLVLQGAPSTVRSYGSGTAFIQGFDVNSAFFLRTEAAASGSVVAPTLTANMGSYGYKVSVAAGDATATGDLTFAGTITGGNGYLWLLGGGSVKLTGSSNYTSYTRLDTNTRLILAGGANRIASSAYLSMAAGSQLVLGDASGASNNAIPYILPAGAGSIVGGSSAVSTLTLNHASTATTLGSTFTLGGSGVNQNNLALALSSSATVNLNGVSTFTGGTTVGGTATLNLGIANALAPTGAVAVSGGTLAIGAFNQSIGALTLSAGSITGTTGILSASSLGFGNAGSASVSAILGGTAALTKTGAGTLSLTAANTYSGGTVVEAGVLQLGAAGATGAAGSGSLDIRAGGTLRLSRTGDYSIGNTLVGSGSLDKQESGVATYSGDASGFTGALTVSAGTLAYTGAGTLGYATATVAAGANLTLASGHAVGAGRALNLRGAQVNDASSADFTGDLSLAGGTLNVGGAGTVGTVLLAGNLSVGASSTVNFDLATVETVGAGSSDLLRVSGDVAFASGATVNLVAGSLASATYRLITYTGALAGFDNLAISFNSGAPTRSTFTKVDNAAAKAVEVIVGSAAANLRWTGSLSQSWDVTTTANFTNPSLADDDVFFAADNVAFDGLGAGAVTLAGNLTAGAVTVSGTENYTLAGGSTLSATSLAKSGASQLTLATPVSVTESGSVSGGTLQIGTGGSYAGPLSVGADATLTLAAGTLSGSASLAGGTINLAGGSASSTLTVDSGTVTVAGATLSGAATINGGTFSLTSGSVTSQITMTDGALSLTGGTASGGLVVAAGTVTVAGATLSGATTINGGSLSLTSGSLTGPLTFAGSTASLTGGTSSGGLTVTSGAATVNGATLTGAATVDGGTLSYLAAGTFAANHTVGASGELILSLASGTQTLTGSLAGSGLITKRGAGTLVYTPSAHATFAGSLVVEAGTLQVSSGGTDSPLTFTAEAIAAGNLTVRSGATLDLPRLHATTGQTATWALPTVTLQSGSTVVFRATTGTTVHNANFNLAVGGEATISNNGGSYDHDITLSGAVTGSGRISYLATTSSGSDAVQRTLTLTRANNTFSGDWFVDYTVSTSDDFVELRSNAAGSLGTGTVILDDRARLINNASGGINSLAGVSLLKSTSTLNLTAQGWTNTAATLGMAAGTVSLGAGANSVGNLSGAGGTIQAGNAASALTVNQTTDGTFGGVLASTAGSALAFVKTGAATLTLTGASTAAGTFAVNQGKVVLSGGENRLFTAANITVAAGATLEIASTNALRRQDAATQGTLTLDGGTLLISGASTTGAHLGVLTLANGATLAASPDAGTYFGWHVNLNGDVTVGGTSSSAISASIGLLGSRTFSVADATGSAAVDLDVSGAVRDSDTVAGTLVKAGLGTLRLGSGNAFTGGLSLTAGTVVIGHASALGTGAVTLSTGGVLDLAGLNPANTIVFAGGTVANAGSWTGLAALSGGSYEAADLNGLAGGAVEVRAGSFADLSGVTKDILLTGGAVSGLDAFTRTLSVTGGTLDLSAIDFSLAPLAGTLEVRAGGAIDFGQAEFGGSVVYRGGTLAGSVADFDAVVTGANVLLADGALTGGSAQFVIGAGQSAVLGAGLTDTVRLAGGAITGGLLGPAGFAGLLIIEGQGNLTLANPTYDLALTGPQNLRLRDGGRLAGVGDLGTAVVAAGGILAPGNSPGTLAFNGNLQLETLGTLQFEVASVLAGEGSLDGGPVAGQEYDTLTVAGELNLANLSSAQRFLLELISLDGFNQEGFAPEGWDDTAPYQFTLVDYATLDLGTNTAGIDGDITNLFTIDADGFVGSGGASLSAVAFKVLVDAENSRLVLTYTPIPEPSTYGLALGALALAVAAVRRRRKG